MSALGEFTASLAHELSQPLTAILSNAQVAQHLLAADRPESRGACARSSATSSTDDKRAAAVIRGSVTLVKKGDPEFVPLDLNELIGEVAWLVRNDADPPSACR